jgi:hypothetical protein
MTYHKSTNTSSKQITLDLWFYSLECACLKLCLALILPRKHSAYDASWRGELVLGVAVHAVLVKVQIVGDTSDSLVMLVRGRLVKVQGSPGEITEVCRCEAWNARCTLKCSEPSTPGPSSADCMKQCLAACSFTVPLAVSASSSKLSLPFNPQMHASGGISVLGRLGLDLRASSASYIAQRMAVSGSSHSACEKYLVRTAAHG